MNRELLYFKMLLLGAEIEMNAMIAENKWREMVGQVPAYREDSFMELIDKWRIHDNNFPSYRGAESGEE